MDIKTKIQDLRKKLNDHNYHYYVLNDPIISDSEYDELLRLLQDIEQKKSNRHQRKKRKIQRLNGKPHPRRPVSAKGSRIPCTPAMGSEPLSEN